MRKLPLAVSTFRLKNFKAVRDSKVIRFTPLTVFIGNNGVGKSSVVEGLETLKFIATEGLDKAMQRWRGFDNIWNKATPHTAKFANDTTYYTNPMTFQVSGTAWTEGKGVRSFRAFSEITTRDNQEEIFYLREELKQTQSGLLFRLVQRDEYGKFLLKIDDKVTTNPRLAPDESVLSAEPLLSRWQFVRLNPDAMAYEKQMGLVRGRLMLSPDGSNIAEYLLDLRQRSSIAFNSIVETMQTVLPYVKDVQPVITREVGRSAYLRLVEGNFRLPGWLFSTGTLRVVALLALFRHPDPPPLVVIEELENGLDPRTISLIIEEIREVVRSGRSQVIITTHSPYLLDLVPLSSLVFVERVDGQPTFTRPSDDESVQRWSDDFGPGKLYTMGRFRESK